MTREESIAFYKEHSKRLYNISLRIVQDSALAEEIMQDTILKALRLALRPFDPSTSSGRRKLRAAQVQGPGNKAQGPVSKAQENAWLTKTCIRASIDELRKRKRERLFLDEYAAEEAPNYFTPESIDIPKDELSVDRIKASINSLQDPYRLVLNLVLIDGLDYEEISSITGEREGTIRTQYSRARKMLASKLTEIK